MTLYGVNLADMTNILQTRNPILHLFRPHLTGEVFSSGDRFDGYGIRLDITRDQLANIMAVYEDGRRSNEYLRFYENPHGTPRGWSYISLATGKAMIAEARAAAKAAEATQ